MDIASGSTATVMNTTFLGNIADGGAGGTGADGGDAYGGGFYIDTGAVATITDSTILLNLALGGSATLPDTDGEGIGGGVYTLGTFDDISTNIALNLASTSGNNIGP